VIRTCNRVGIDTVAIFSDAGAFTPMGFPSSPKCMDNCFLTRALDGAGAAPGGGDEVLAGLRRTYATQEIDSGATAPLWPTARRSSRGAVDTICSCPPAVAAPCLLPTSPPPRGGARDFSRGSPWPFLLTASPASACMCSRRVASSSSHPCISLLGGPPCGLLVDAHLSSDRNAQHVAMADEAHHIGPSPAAQSYLNAERILEVANNSGSDGACVTTPRPQPSNPQPSTLTPTQHTHTLSPWKQNAPPLCCLPRAALPPLLLPHLLPC
jgi:hypothetical protein